MSEMLDVLSKLDQHDNPLLNNCTLALGELTLEFKNGRSKVPPQHAAQALLCPKLTIPGYDGPAAEPPPNVAAALPGDGDEGDEDAGTREALLQAAREHLQSEGVDVPETKESTKTVESSTKAKGSNKTKDPKDGFERETADGQPRCMARKGDGTQCANAAVDGDACRLAAHKKQLSK